MQVTLLAVGLIVGFALGLGVGWYFWHPSGPAEDERPERSERHPARYPRSHEPSTPPQHRPSPRPRPVTALHHPNPLLTNMDHAPGAEPASPRPVEPDAPAVPASQPVPEAEVTFRPSPRPAAAAPEPAPAYEYRPAPNVERPVSIGQPQPADRQLLSDLLETNRRLTADAERRLRREGAPAVEQLNLDQRPSPRPPASAPAPNDLLARHRKLEEDSRRMGRRAE